MNLSVVVMICSIAMAQGDVIRGRVSDENRLPVRGAEVVLSTDEKLIERVSVDGEGLFQFKIKSDDAKLQGYTMLTAFAIGRAFDTEALGSLTQQTDVPLFFSLTLRKVKPCSIRVLDPVGKPISGAKVAGFQSSFPTFATLPAELVDSIGVVTDEKGTATFTDFPISGLQAVRVVHPDWGTQIVRKVNREIADWSDIHIATPCTVRGKVVGLDPERLKRLKISVHTYGKTPTMYASTAMNSEIVPSADGSFQAQCVKGQLSVSCNYPLEWDVGAAEVKPFDVGSTEKSNLTIQFVKSAPLSGRVTTEDQKTGIADVEVTALHRGHNGRMELAKVVRTDKNGNFQFLLGPGSHFCSLKLPEGWTRYKDVPIWATIDVPLDGSETKLKPFSIQKGHELTGIATDEVGEPLAGIVVNATITHREGGNGYHETKTATTNRQGEFKFVGLPYKQIIKLQASVREKGLYCNSDAILGTTKLPKILVLGKEESVGLRGVVRDGDGKPVAKAKVNLEAINGGWHRRLLFSNSDVILTDEQGEFQFPTPINVQGTYQVYAAASGFAFAESAVLNPSKVKVSSLQLKLRKINEYAGHIVDSKSKPVRGATVTLIASRSNIEESITNENGAYSFNSTAGEDGIVVVKAPGYRTQVDVIFPNRSFLIQIETPREHSEAKKETARKSLVATTKPRVFIERILAPYEVEALASPDPQKRARFFETTLCRLAPQRGLMLLERDRAIPGEQRRRIMEASAVAMAKVDFESALPIITGMNDREQRFRALYMIFLAADAWPAEARRELVTRLLTEAKLITDPAERVGYIGIFAGQLIGFGEKAQARRIVDELRPQVTRLSKNEHDSYFRSLYAHPLAYFDLAAALKLIESKETMSEYLRYHGEMAIFLADKAPMDAEKVLGMMENPRARDPAAVAVVANMASTDLPRAKEILKAIDTPILRVRARVQMAKRLAKSDPKTAKELIDQAFEIAEGSRTSFGGGEDFACELGVSFETIQQIASEDLETFVARAIVLESPLRSPNRGSMQQTLNQQMTVRCALGALLAPYRPDVARAYLNQALSLFHKPGEKEEFEDGGNFNSMGLAIALVAPGEATQLVERLFDAADTKRKQRCKLILVQVCDSLAADRSECLKQIMPGSNVGWRIY